MKYEDCWSNENCKQTCTPNCVKFKLLKSLFNLSGLPENLWKMQKLDCDKLDEKAFVKLETISFSIDKFVEQSRNIYIWSFTCGNGKTSWAIKLMQNYFFKVWHKSAFCCKAKFLNVPKFLVDSKNNIDYKEDWYKQLCNDLVDCDLVVWDELSCSNMTDYEHQLIYNLLDSRISSGKSNIITGNLPPEDCEEKFGKRLSSRIFNDQIIEFKGRDRRGDKYGTATDFE